MSKKLAILLDSCLDIFRRKHRVREAFSLSELMLIRNQ